MFLKAELLEKKSTIGFVGTPWTLLVYILNKKSQKIKKIFLKIILINRILNILDKFLKFTLKTKLKMEPI